MLLVHVLSVGVGVVLGLLGGGGAILAVPILAYAGHLSPKSAIATSLVVVGATAAAGALRHARAGNVLWRKGLAFAAAGMTGAFGGARLSALVPGHWLLVGFAALMLVSAVFMFRPLAARPSRARHPAWVLPVGVGVGALTGLVGAGGGFVIVPALTLLLGVEMRKAVGTSLLVIALQSAAGVMGHLGETAIDPALAATVTGAAIGGLLLGAAASNRVSQPRLKQAFAALMVVAGLYIGARELRAVRSAPEDARVANPAASALALD